MSHMNSDGSFNETRSVSYRAAAGLNYFRGEK